MSTLDKLRRRLLSLPSDFTYDEMRRFLIACGYVESTRGATSGSRLSFYRARDEAMIQFHRPHPGNVMDIAAVKATVKKLKEYGDLNG